MTIAGLWKTAFRLANRLSTSMIENAVGLQPSPTSYDFCTYPTCGLARNIGFLPDQTPVDTGGKVSKASQRAYIKDTYLKRVCLKTGDCSNGAVSYAPSKHPKGKRALDVSTPKLWVSLHTPRPSHRACSSGLRTTRWPSSCPGSSRKPSAARRAEAQLRRGQSFGKRHTWFALSSISFG